MAMMFRVTSRKNSVRGSGDGNDSSSGSSQPLSTAARVVLSNLPAGFDSEPRPFMKRLSSKGDTPFLPEFRIDAADPEAAVICRYGYATLSLYSVE